MQVLFLKYQKFLIFCKKTFMCACNVGATARDRFVATLFTMTWWDVWTKYVVPARDCTRRGDAASVTLVPRERLRCRVAALLVMTEKATSLGIVMKLPVGLRTCLKPSVGTTKYVQACSCLLSAASRTAGTCPRPTEGVSFLWGASVCCCCLQWIAASLRSSQ